MLFVVLPKKKIKIENWIFREKRSGFYFCPKSPARVLTQSGLQSSHVVQFLRLGPSESLAGWWWVGLSSSRHGVGQCQWLAVDSPPAAATQGELPDAGHGQGEEALPQSHEGGGRGRDVVRVRRDASEMVTDHSLVFYQFCQIKSELNR